MHVFEIKEDFLLDGKAVKLISGAIHYFRMTTDQWEDSLYNLKALGANTVETYIPWNIHEPFEGQFDFEGNKNIEKFVKLAQDLGLMVILRPSVYICAEWEFGGLPSWILNEKGIRLRSTDSRFMQKVRNYFSILIPKLTPLQLNEGGPVIMMQIENEYGSYGMEKEYLRQTKNLMREFGITQPLFTSDGAWNEALDAGTLIEDDVFVTGNFGSQSKENAAILRDFMDRHEKKWPIMCMEYWDGWFNRWGEAIIKRDADDLAKDVKEMLQIGSLNLYMFHGGTNFGFYNGCSARGSIDLPQITSYDYDALLTEWGEPTEKYYAVQKAIKEVCPDVWQATPRSKKLTSFGTHPVTASVSLFNTLDTMSSAVHSTYPKTMEEASTGYGYLLYNINLKNYFHENKLKIVEANDRVQVFIEGEHIATQYQQTLGDELIYSSSSLNETLSANFLVENLGRVNYGFRFNSPTQSKGIRGGIIHDIHFQQGYTHYPLPLDSEQIKAIDFSAKSNERQPSFYQIKLTIDEVEDTFIDCSAYGKGCIFVNGINLGRYWNEGPVYSLYCPKEFLTQGDNEIVIFETEGIAITHLTFSDHPLYERTNS